MLRFLLFHALMKRKMTVFCSLVTFVFFIISIGLFFELNFPDIKNTIKYSGVAQCSFYDSEITSRYEFNKNCPGCREAYRVNSCSYEGDIILNTSSSVQLSSVDCGDGSYDCDEDDSVRNTACTLCPYLVYTAHFYGITDYDNKTTNIHVIEHYGKDYKSTEKRLADIPLDEYITCYVNKKNITMLFLIFFITLDTGLHQRYSSF